MTRHEMAHELAESWINGNRNFVMEEIKAQDTNGVRGDLNMLAAVAIVLKDYGQQHQLDFLSRATRLT